MSGLSVLRHRSRAWSMAAVAAFTGAAMALAPANAAFASSTAVLLRFDNAEVGDAFTSLTNSGLAASTKVSILADAGGVIRSVKSSAGQGNSGDLPAYGAGRAVAVVRNSTSTDVMNPGTGRLEFGADLTLDAGTTNASSSDNGNNAVQRGLYNDGAQFKLQVDNLTPSCRIKGSGGAAGAVEVAGATLKPATRYRIRCLRPASSNTVWLTVAPINADGTLGTARTTSLSSAKGSAIGALSYALTTPLNVGGKTYYDAASRTIKFDSSSDQFNGTLDNVTLRLG